MPKEVDEVISAREQISKCKRLDNKEKQIACIYDTLHNITKAQDIVNLTIRSIIDNSEDPRWIPIIIADNANAIMLGISESRGNPKSIVRSGGYVEEKVNSLDNNWNMLRLRHKG